MLRPFSALFLTVAVLSAQDATLPVPTAPPLPKGTPSAPSDVYRSVVRIEVATQVPDYGTPWNAGRFSGGIGTGFIIGKNKILTNAHVVSNQRRILITIHGSPEKYPAKVEHIAHDCDLALLSVEDFSAFESFPTFSFGDIPALESQVRVIGYPVGGERLSVTRGVVSRIDFQPYSHSRADSHLVVQIDAAINPGNSGGPVIQDNKVVGVAFQGLRAADNTGYIIPTPVVKRFLKDIEDGNYDHYAELGVNEFPLHNPAMRKALGLPNDGVGVLVTNVIPTSSADGVLKSGDVLVSLDGKEVDSAGMVLVDGEKVNYNEIIERKFAGDKVAVRFRRDGGWNDVEVTLKPLHWSRMYAIEYEKNPRYLVFAGLVFQPLDTNLFATAKFNDVTLRRLYTDYVPKGLFQKHKDIVVLTRVESDPVTSQLSDFNGYAVEKVNGTEVKDLKHLNELLHPETPPEFHVIELFGANRPIIIPASKVDAANQRVQENYGINQLSNLED
ncbi:MAG: trypsin-like peptidase domain-containing protein [Akkermansiaceae bacterium]|nr:trypsin-like peptidase domain-containing protein [Akkermansiaceae bacterium]